MSSDSSDEDNLDLLREAVDSQFFNDSMFNEKPSDSVIENSKPSKKELPPSLRKAVDEDEQFSLFRVTPEFRNYVAKQLSKSLDEKLQKLLKRVTVDNIPKKKCQKTGVRLFSNSEKFLKIQKRLIVDNIGIQNKVVTKKSLVNRSLNKSFKQIDENLLKTVAVHPEDILSKKDTKVWSTRSKAPVYHYRKSSEGHLVLIESSSQ